MEYITRENTVIETGPKPETNGVKKYHDGFISKQVTKHEEEKKDVKS